MNTLSPDEQAIIDQFYRLDKAQQQRVLNALQQSRPPAAPFDVEGWLATVEQIRTSMTPPYTQAELMQVLDDIRGENDAD